MSCGYPLFALRCWRWQLAALSLKKAVFRPSPLLLAVRPERSINQDVVPSSAGRGFEFHFTNFNQLKREMQSFPVVAKPTLLAHSQLVRLRLDLGEEELVVTEYNQIWPSRTAAPVSSTKYRSISTIEADGIIGCRATWICSVRRPPK
jgi:hypothetical protein